MSTTASPSPPPDASTSLRGLVSTGAQSFAGLKTFTNGVKANAAVESTTGGFKFPDGTIQLTAAVTAAMGGSISSGTSKSVLYVDGGGNLAQDNANFAWDFTNHRLGIGTASPGTTLDVVGLTRTQALLVKVVTVSDADYTALTTDYIIQYNSITANRTVTLPTGASTNKGQIYVIKDASGSCNPGVVVTVVAASGLVDGQTSVTAINMPFAAATYYSDGSNWWSI